MYDVGCRMYEGRAEQLNGGPNQHYQRNTINCGRGMQRIFWQNNREKGDIVQQHTRGFYHDELSNLMSFCCPVDCVYAGTYELSINEDRISSRNEISICNELPRTYVNLASFL